MLSCSVSAAEAVACLTSASQVLPSNDVNVLLHRVGHVLLVLLPGLNVLLLQLSHVKLLLLLHSHRIFALLCAFDLYLALGLHHFLACHLS